MAVPDDFLLGRVIATNVVDPATGEITRANDEITEDLLDKLRAGVTGLSTLYINDLDRGGYISQTLRIDEPLTSGRPGLDIYRMMRPGEPPTEAAVEGFSRPVLHAEERYDLSSVGRMKFNAAPTPRDRRQGAGRLMPARRRAGHGRACWSPTTSSRGGGRAGRAAMAAARSTTSTTSATAACARSASSPRTSSVGLVRVERAVKERLSRPRSTT